MNQDDLVINEAQLADQDSAIAQIEAAYLKAGTVRAVQLARVQKNKNILMIEKSKIELKISQPVDTPILDDQQVVTPS